MNRGAILTMIATASLALAASSLLVACSSSGSGSSRGYVSYGPGYRGYHSRPWGYRPIYIDGGIDPDLGGGSPLDPVAVPMPELGMPDFGGGMDIGGFDMGGFDW